MGSVATNSKRKRGGRLPGKIDASLEEKLKSVQWGEYRIGDLFEIEKTLSFNTDRLTEGNEYDYVTRTSINQGILQETGFVNRENINEAGTWSLGLLQMDFFYRQKPWYAGQFVRKIVPKETIKNRATTFFTVVLNSLKPLLLSVLVRNVDNTFVDSVICLPTKNKKIDFDFMEAFVAELEAQRVAELEAYLTVTGLNDYVLTEEEEQAIAMLGEDIWNDIDVVKLFDVVNTKSILARDIEPGSGTIPYLCASAENNSVSSYITYDEALQDKGNCIFIGGKTFVVSYQEHDFFSNDSHNLALHLKEEDKKSRFSHLFLVTCVKKSLEHRYSWGDSISNRKIQNDQMTIPFKIGEINYEMMNNVISAVQKLVIKDVVLWADKRIAATKEVVNG